MKLKCTNGHDRCYLGTSEDCPYCEIEPDPKYAVRLPDDYMVMKPYKSDDVMEEACLQPKTPFQPVMTLNEYSKLMFQQNVFLNSVAEDILKANHFIKDLPKPTRKQRFKWFWQDKMQRAKDIWTILSGGDIHKDCGDW